MDKPSCGGWKRGPANSEINEFSCFVVCHCAEVGTSSCGEWTRGTANAEFDEFFVASSAILQKLTNRAAAGGRVGP